MPAHALERDAIERLSPRSREDLYLEGAIPGQYGQYKIALDLLGKMGIRLSEEDDESDQRTAIDRPSHSADILFDLKAVLSNPGLFEIGAVRLYGVERSERALGFSIVKFAPGVVQRTPGAVAEAAQVRRPYASTRLATEKFESTGDAILDGGVVANIQYHIET